jgi:predicted PurR-regulated permease PerM
MPGKENEGAISTGDTAAPFARQGRTRPTFSDLAKVFQSSTKISAMTLTGIFLLGLVAFLRYAAPFLLPVVFAILLFFLLHPLILVLHSLRIPRMLGAALVLAILIGAIVVGVSALQEPAKDWAGKAPESLRKVQTMALDFIRRVERFTGAEDRREELSGAAEIQSGNAAAKSFKLADTLLSYTTLITTASFLGGFLETVVLLFFLLAAGDRFLQILRRVLPRQDDKHEALALVNDVQQNISRFLFTVTLINICVGLLVALAMSLLGMPNPILWGVIAGVLNYIPYFGPFSVSVVLLLAGLLSFDTTGRTLLPAIVYLAVHAVESNVITPAILGRRLTLNPLVIFLALMFWTWLWGMAGALLAVPLLMCFKIVCEHVKPLAPIGELIGG